MDEPGRICAFVHCCREVEGRALCSRHFDQLPEFHRLRLMRTRRQGIDSRAYGRAVREAVKTLTEAHVRKSAKSR